MKTPSGRHSCGVHFIAPTWLILVAVLWLLAGCTHQAPGTGYWDGPSTPVSVLYDSWSFEGQRGRLVKTPHYQIYTTITDEDFLDRLAQVMEGALEQYQRIAPEAPLSSRPMICYVFANRQQWATYTRKYTGPDAAVYLRINRGGYTIRDTFVSYFIGDVGTFAIASHEGWHQYLGRNFKGRLPPCLEEGIATAFEQIRWSANLPQWNLSRHLNRTLALRRATETRKLWPLETLCAMHAGDVVHLPGDRLDTFYAQNWALARFLWDGENQKYRPALQKFLSDTAAGTVLDPTLCHQAAGRPWVPAGVKPMLQHYFGTDLATLDREYRAYIESVAYTHLRDQWQ